MGIRESRLFLDRLFVHTGIRPGAQSMNKSNISTIRQLALSFRADQAITLLNKFKCENDREDLLEFEDKLRLTRLEMLLNIQLGIKNESLLSSYLLLLKSKSASTSPCSITRSLNSHLNNPTRYFNDSCKFIFISGLARSGTSALGRAFDQCIENTSILPERYPWDVGYSPFSFHPNFVFRADNSYRLRTGFYQNIESQYKHLFNNSSFFYLGDKRPRFLYSLEVTKKLFSMTSKAITVIHIIRNPIDVAASWQKRSEDLEDTWPAWQNYEVMVKDSVCQTEVALDTVKNPSPGLNFVLCDYESVFSDAEKLYKLFCLVAPEKRISKGTCARVVNESAAIAQRKREIPERISSFFERDTTAAKCFEKLRKLSSV